MCYYAKKRNTFCLFIGKKGNFVYLLINFFILMLADKQYFEFFR